MMRLSILAFGLFLLASCSNNANDEDKSRPLEIPVDSTDVGVEELTKADYYVWHVDNEEKTIRRNNKLMEEYLNVDTLIIGLNEMFPNVQMEKVKQSHDTLYTRIPNSEHLTERMGSSGSEFYIAQAVVNLTSLAGIRHVRIDFEEGSHASPGVFSRENFKDYKEVQ